MKIYERYMNEAKIPANPEAKKLYKDYIKHHKTATNELVRIKTLLDNHRKAFMSGPGPQTPSGELDIKALRGKVEDMDRVGKNLHKIIVWHDIAKGTITTGHRITPMF